MPPWLAPVQVEGIPIADRHVPHLQDIAARLHAAGVRVEIDTADERMQKKVAKARNQRVPFMLLAGDQDVEDGTVSLRDRDGSEQRGLPIDEAVAQILGAVAEPAHEHDPVEELL
jgi:threonyl-tRNA synthetase